MSSKTKRLSALADIYQAENLDGSIARLRLDRLQPSREQPRLDRKIGVDELASSLKKDGLLSPIVVKKEGAQYRIIAGERRFHAASSLGWEHIECRIISRAEADYWRIAIIENLQRENLSPFEEASALLRLKKQEGLSDAQLSELVGKSRNYITEILGIAQLPRDVLEKCKQHGIQQRNMLIQVVQSYRKGLFREFLENYRQGRIKNVQQARLFNQQENNFSNALHNVKSKHTPSKANANAQKPADASANADKKFRLEIEGTRLIIQCPSHTEAQKLSRQLKNNLRRY